MTERFVSPCHPPEGWSREMLTILGEECHEVVIEAGQIGQRASKALRFGLDEVQPGQEFDNAWRLGMEIGDLLAVADRLAERGVIPREAIEEGRRRKGRQLAKFLQSATDGAS